MSDRFGMLVTLGMRDGKHVQRVIVVRILISHETQVGDRLIVLAAIDRKRRGVKPLVDRLGRRFARSRLPLADVQVQTDALVQLLLFGILPQNRLEQVRRPVVIVTLKRIEAAFVNRDGFEIR
jgi:hypothetical protein